MIEKLFKLKENNTTVKTELLAGLITFLTMAYILAVNPLMLQDAGMSKQSVFLSTAIASGIASILMGILANYPVALSTGMGVNAFITYTICLTYGYSHEATFAAIFISGILFLIISVTGIRKYLINIIPKDLKLAIGAGIGFFITFIGLKNAGIVVADASTYIALGSIKNPEVMLAVFGIVVTFILYIRNVKASIFLGIVITAIVGLILNFFGFTGMPQAPESLINSEFDTSTFFIFAKGFKELFSRSDIFLVLFSLLFVDFFDTTGSLIVISNRANLVDKDGNIKNVEKALVADSLGTVIGSCLGTSTVTAFIESTAGVESGGRTGLTAVTTGILFLVSVFFYPLLSVITSSITTPALVIVGILMAQQLSEIDWKNDIIIAISGFMTIIGMILSSSISDGIAIGFLSYTVCMLGAGKIKNIPVGILILDIIFITYFLI